MAREFHPVNLGLTVPKHTGEFTKLDDPESLQAVFGWSPAGWMIN
jgi:hypothetical protein